MSRDRRAIPDSLIAAAKAGDVAALRDLYDGVRPYVGFLLLKLAGDAVGLDDLSHEICAEVLLNIRRFRGPGKFSTWVYAVAARQVRHWRRRQRLAQALLAAHASLHREAPRRPDDALLRREAIVMASEAILDLPRRMYLSLVLLDIVGLGPAEAAAEIGGTPRAVTNAASHAKQKIHERFVEVGLVDAAPNRKVRGAPAPAAGGIGPSGPVAGEGVRHDR